MDLEPGKDLELKPSILPPSPGSWQSKNQKKQRSAALLRAQEDFGAVPHSFVFHRGRVGRNVRQLSMDLRRVMEPYTARALKVSGGGGADPHGIPLGWGGMGMGVRSLLGAL